MPTMRMLRQLHLKELGLAGNKLDKFTLPSSCQLEALNLRDNPELDVLMGNLGACSNLKSIAIINDNFTNDSIDISRNLNLEAFKAKGNRLLTMVDISKHKKLSNIQLDDTDYVITKVSPNVGSDGKLTYDYSGLSFVIIVDPHLIEN